MKELLASSPELPSKKAQWGLCSHLSTIIVICILSIFYWIDNFEEAYEMDVYFVLPH